MLNSCCYMGFHCQTHLDLVLTMGFCLLYSFLRPATFFWKASNIIPKHIYLCRNKFYWMVYWIKQGYGCRLRLIFGGRSFGLFQLPAMMIICAILNPIFKCDVGMVETGLSAWKQFQTRKELLLDWMICYYDILWAYGECCECSGRVLL